MKKSELKPGTIIIVVGSQYLDGRKGKVIEIGYRGDAITIDFDGVTHIMYPEELEFFEEEKDERSET